MEGEEVVGSERGCGALQRAIICHLTHPKPPTTFNSSFQNPTFSQSATSEIRTPHHKITVKHRPKIFRALPSIVVYVDLRPTQRTHISCAPALVAPPLHAGLVETVPAAATELD